MNYEDIPKEELTLVSDKMIGIALSHFRGFAVDSDGKPIDDDAFYKVERHIPSGRIIIMNTGRSAEKEFSDEFANRMLKKSGKLN